MLAMGRDQATKKLNFEESCRFLGEIEDRTHIPPFSTLEPPPKDGACARFAFRSYAGHVRATLPVLHARLLINTMLRYTLTQQRGDDLTSFLKANRFPLNQPQNVRVPYRIKTAGLRSESREDDQADAVIVAPAATVHGFADRVEESELLGAAVLRVQDHGGSRAVPQRGDQGREGKSARVAKDRRIQGGTGGCGSQIHQRLPERKVR